jgi:hypothetical protein
MHLADRLLLMRCQVWHVHRLCHALTSFLHVFENALSSLLTRVIMAEGTTFSAQGLSALLGAVATFTGWTFTVHLVSTTSSAVVGV